MARRRGAGSDEETAAIIAKLHPIGSQELEKWRQELSADVWAEIDWDSAVFCTTCGKEMKYDGQPHRSWAEAVRCRECIEEGQLLTAQTKFCRDCRKPLQKSDFVEQKGDDRGWANVCKCKKCMSKSAKRSSDATRKVTGLLRKKVRESGRPLA
ncbi:hypothetical protein KGQ24_01595 [Patescibacteria group bacterium]|nr:hypothetical protein [Patescibacteria group bacterium]